MLAIRTIKKTKTNRLLINIPDELRNRNLEIIILPLSDTEKTQIDFFTDKEIEQLSKVNLGNPIIDNEDYSKW